MRGKDAWEEGGLSKGYTMYNVCDKKKGSDRGVVVRGRGVQRYMYS